jgi:dephospho-CoA kinase
MNIRDIKFARMKNKRRKKIIGIVGGIGSGKSTVAAILGEMGFAVIDADEIAHKITEKKIIKKELQKKFGVDIIDKKGKIDRRKMAEVAFVSRKKAAQLNRIIHPPVLAKIEQLIKEYTRKPKVKAIVLDIPLLAEIGWINRCDKVIFVSCSRKSRLQRGKKKGIFNEKKIKNFEKFQFSIDRKRKIADNIIENNGNITNLRKQIARIFPKIIEKG